MRTKAVLMGASLMVAGSLGIAAPASAAPICVGTQATFVQCVDPTGATLIDDCVYVGSPPCMPVYVPGPYVSCIGGDMGEQLFTCDPR